MPPNGLFVYGTLQCPAIWQRITGLQPRQEPATLLGYRRLQFAGQAFPGVVPLTGSRETGGEVDGQMYRNIPAAVWQRLDAYEGNWYERRSLPVVMADGTETLAQVYVVKPQQRFRLNQQPWSYADFLRRHRHQYLRSL